KQIQHSNDMMIASLKNYLVSDMMVAESVLVLVTKPRGSATLPRVFIYDISTEKNLNNITPTTKDLPLVSTAPGIGFLFDGFIVGFSRNIVWKLNISTLDLTIMNMPSSLSISTRGSSCV